MLDLLEYFPLRYPILVPLLNAFGYGIKHRTRIPNEMIPFILFAIASATSVSVRYLMSGYSGWYYWFDIVFYYGIVNSLKLTLYAIGGYEAVRAIRFTSRREEVKNKMRGNFIRSVLGIVAATIIISLVTMMCGSSFFGVFAHLTDAWVGIIFYAVAFNVLGKLVRDREDITPAYIVMMSSLVLSGIMFLMASATANRVVAIAGLGLAMLFGLVAGALRFIPWIKDYKAKAGDAIKPFDAEDYQKKWVKVRERLLKLSPEKQKDLLKAFLCFRLVGDSIYNNVDVNTPLFTIPDDGGTIVLSVDKARNAGVSEEAVASVEGYIASVVDKAKTEEK